MQQGKTESKDVEWTKEVTGCKMGDRYWIDAQSDPLYDKRQLH